MNKKLLVLVLLFTIINSVVFISADCVDSDGGASFFEKGETAVTFPGSIESSQVPEGSTGYSFDNCYQNTLSEAVCEDGNSKFVEYECPNWCFEGFCLKSNEEGYVLTEKRNFSVNFEDKTYEISMESISINSVKIRIDGDLKEITDYLEIGDSQNIDDKLLIKVIDLDAIRMYGVPASVTFTLSDLSQTNPLINLERNNLNWILIVLIIVVLLIVFYLVLTRKKK